MRVACDPEVRGLARRLHQAAQNGARAIHDRGAAQIARPDQKGARPDMPQLGAGIEFDQPPPLHRGQDAVGRGRRLIGIGGKFGQGRAGCGRQMLEHRHRPVERFDRVLIAFVIPRLGPPPRTAGGFGVGRFAHLALAAVQ